MRVTPCPALLCQQSSKHEQAHFKEWLRSTNNIREVQDLARLERAITHERARAGKHRHGSSRSRGAGSERAASDTRASGGLERAGRPVGESGVGENLPAFGAAADAASLQTDVPSV